MTDDEENSPQNHALVQVGGGGGGGGAEEKSSGLEPGTAIDARDSLGKWCEAVVLECDTFNQRVHVTYLYWADTFNEWVPIDVEHIQPYGTMTCELTLFLWFRVLPEASEAFDPLMSSPLRA